MIGDGELVRLARRFQRQGFEIFGDVFCQRRDPGRLLGIVRILAEHVAVILDRGAAARCRDDDGVEAVLLDLADPDVDIAAGEIVTVLRTPHMVHQRPATALAGHLRDGDAMTVEQADRRFVDAGIEHGLGAALEDRHAPAFFALRGEFARSFLGRAQVGRRPGARSSIAPMRGPTFGSAFATPLKGLPR